MKRERADTDLDIFLVFCCGSCMCLLGALSSHIQSESGTPLQSSPKMGAMIFYHLHIVPNWPFFIVFDPPLHKWLFHLSFFLPIKISHQFAPDRFLFLMWVSTACPNLLIPFTFIAFLSFCFFACLDSLSYICSLPFHHLVVEQ